jgi:hypothetical protein
MSNNTYYRSYTCCFKPCPEENRMSVEKKNVQQFEYSVIFFSLSVSCDLLVTQLSPLKSLEELQQVG